MLLFLSFHLPNREGFQKHNGYCSFLKIKAYCI